MIRPAFPIFLEPYRPKIMRVLMSFVVLAGGLVVGSLAIDKGPAYALAATLPFVVIGLDLVLRRMDMIPVIILMAATATEFYISKGITPALILTAGFTVLWIVQMIAGRRPGLIDSPVMVPAIGFALVAAISLIWGNVLVDPLLNRWAGGSDYSLIQVAQLAVLMMSPCALILTANLIKTRSQLQTLMYGFIFLSGAGIIVEALRLPFHLSVRGLVSTWAVSLMYGQLLFNPEVSKPLRVLFIGLIGVWVYERVLVNLGWWSGWMPFMISVGIITVIKSRRIILLGLVVLVIAFFVYRPWFEAQYAAQYAESGDSRLNKWALLYNEPFVRAHWLFGTGPFGYARYFMTYIPYDAASTHNNYIDIILQMGLMGVVVFAWLVGTLVRTAYKARETARGQPFLLGFVYSTWGCIVAVLVAMGLGDWFTPFVLNQGLHGFSWTVCSWVFLGALVAVPNIVQHEQSQAVTQSI